jgi:hypothetical protein
MNGEQANPWIARKRRWIRAAGVALVCLLGGAGMTAIVAALCLMYAPARMVEDHGGVTGDDRAPGVVGFRHGQLYAGIGYREWMDYYWTSFEKGSVSGAGVSAVRCGWPFLALSTPPERFPPTVTAGEWQQAIKVAYAKPTIANVAPAFLRARATRPLPTRPLVLGLLGDAVFYGAGIAALWYSVPAARRAMRRRRGQCASCGYALGGLATCPECGTSASGLIRRMVRAIGRPALSRFFPGPSPEPVS